MTLRLKDLVAALWGPKKVRPGPAAPRPRLALEELEARRVPSVSPLKLDLQADQQLATHLQARLTQVQADIVQDQKNLAQDNANQTSDLAKAQKLKNLLVKTEADIMQDLKTGNLKGLKADQERAADLLARLGRVQTDLARDKHDLAEDGRNLQRDTKAAQTLQADLALLNADIAADGKGGGDLQGDQALLAAVQALLGKVNHDVTHLAKDTAKDAKELKADGDLVQDLKGRLAKVQADIAQDLKSGDVKKLAADQDRAQDLQGHLDRANADVAGDQADLARDGRNLKSDLQLALDLAAVQVALQADILGDLPVKAL
jgi:hypothetical protein